MKKWHTVFLDDSQFSGLKDEEWELGAEALEDFEAAAKAGELDGRNIYGMWIIDYDTEQADVIAISRDVPSEIRDRHNAYLKHSMKV